MTAAVIGVNIDSGEELQGWSTGFKGTCFANAGLDGAWCDAAAKARSEPLWQVVGGCGPTARAGVDILMLNRAPDTPGHGYRLIPSASPRARSSMHG